MIPSRPLTGSWPSDGNTHQQFWSEFIDQRAWSSRQTSSGSYTDISGICAPRTSPATVSISSGGTKGITAPPAAPQYMSYTDNPARGLLCASGSVPF